MTVAHKSPDRGHRSKKPEADKLKGDLPAIAAAVAALRQLNRGMRTEEAAFYLTEGRGVLTSAGHLRNLRVSGGGPAFRLAGRYPIYTIASLDAYADRRIGPERLSSSAAA
jgi:hypothetical protein